MKIAILGAGNMGSGFAKAFGKTPHEVVLVGRETAKVAAAAQSAGANVEPSTDAATAVAQADVVLIALPFDAAVSTVRELGDLSGKTVVDITNPLTPDYMALTIGHTTSASEEIAKAAPTAKVVKAFNTILAQVLHAGPRFGDRRAQVFVAGNDAAAKDLVSGLAEDLGFDALDAGPLANARHLEALAAQNIQFAYALGQGVQIAPVWLKREG